MMSDVEVIAELLREQHGVEVTGQDLQEIQEFLWLRSQTQVAPLSAPGDIGYTSIDLHYDVVKIIGFVAGAVLGALFLPALGLAAGWFTGALLGGAIGYRLASLFEGGSQQAPTKPSDTTLFRFSGVGGLVVLGQPIPKIYSNRDNNPDGGIYLNDPGQIYTRVTSRKGSRYLDQVSVLGVGRLGEVSATGLKLDDKPLTDWEAGDVTVLTTTGRHDQPAISPNIIGYSQALAVPSNSYVGLAPAVKIGAYYVNLDVIYWISTTNTYIWRDGDLVKVINAVDGWNAHSPTTALTLSDSYGSYIVLSATLCPNPRTSPSSNVNPVVRAALGFHQTDTPGNNPSNWAFAFEIAGAAWTYSVAGSAIATGIFTVPANNQTKVEIRIYRATPNPYLQVILNNVEVVRETRAGLAITSTAWGVVGFHSREAYALTPRYGAVSASGGDIQPGLGRRFQVPADSINKLRSGQIYRSENNSNDISIVGKDAVAGWIEFSQEVWFATENYTSEVTTPITIFSQQAGVVSNLMVTYRAAITTTRKVTGCELIIQANVWARNSANTLVPHAQAFRIVIVDPAKAEREAGRFIVVSTDEKPTIKSILIENLPLNIYTFKIYPLSAKEITANINSLADNETITTLQPTGLVVEGQQIKISAELGSPINPADAASKLSFDGKVQTSSDSGPAMQVTHINELVAKDPAPTYPGYTLGYTRSIASDRLQSAPTISWDIRKGAVVRQYLAYGLTLASATSDRITIATPGLAATGITKGDQVRVLGLGTRVITAVISASVVECKRHQCQVTTTLNDSTITVAAADYAIVMAGMQVAASGIPGDAIVLAKLPGNKLLLGDEWGQKRSATATATVAANFNDYFAIPADEEAVFFSEGSSNYFPDLYVDRLINPVDGLGAYVDQDYFIDYESIVYSRKFCVRNKFFYDGVFSDGTFESWAVATAPSSLLYCTEINGRFALIPQEGAPARPFIFNDSNCSKYVEPGVPWQQEATNTLLVKYQDNQGREKQLKLQTTAAANFEEIEIAQTITTQGVTSKAQAQKVGTVALKSIKAQVKTNQLETDIARGLYAKQGDIIRTQHTSIEYTGQNNGFILTAAAVTNARPSTIRQVAIKAINGGYIVTDPPHQLTATDTITISGNTGANTSGSYAAGQWTAVDASSLIIGAITTSGTGGILSVQRTVYDQEVTLSEGVTLSASSRISVAHSDRNAEENLTIEDLGNGRYLVKGVERPISAGDAWILGAVGIVDRYWRLTSLKPDIKTNTVACTGVLWSDDILDPAGVVLVE